MSLSGAGHSPTRPDHIVVVGGGFSGTMAAVNIARLTERPVRITVVNTLGPVGRGVAYAVRRPEYLLNVAARNMSAFPHEPDHFLDWLRTRSEFEQTPEIELRERFVAREIYGDYLRSIAQHHLQSPGEGAHATSTLVNGEAVDVEPAGVRCRVRLTDGSLIEADRVVLATGNEPPAPLPGAEQLTDHPAWVANPWQAWEQRLPPYDGTVVLLGTGLTAVDAIITLRALGWLGCIHAISRHGWFPQSHFRGIEYPEFPPADVDLSALGLPRLLMLVEEHCARLHSLNANPAIIVDKLRPYTQQIWAAFSREERLAFAKDHAARWNVFRHRIAPELYSQITSSQLTGQLRVHAASITNLAPSGGRIQVDVADGQSVHGDLVINATGPSTRFTATRSVLLQNLLRRGLIAPDTTDLGAVIDTDHTALTDSGERSPWLLLLGPLLRGTYWETIAVPELRVQARRVAETILGSVRAEQESQLQLEYMV
ncbi:FAD/NAD(P)-binding protein [Mycolicibacterium sp. Dal123E01]|uniref:FAD/NAD(P)-binding protein n=1 Tax=Mycolicibacterium sp. Dal123E01 TaxID=3457578 RepID=UPI00403E9E37